MKEKEVLEVFPIGQGHGFEAEVIRRALFHVIWAFERVAGQDSLVGPSFRRVLQMRGSTTSLEEHIEDLAQAAVVMRACERLLQDAAQMLTIVLMDRRAAARAGTP